MRGWEGLYGRPGSCSSGFHGGGTPLFPTYLERRRLQGLTRVGFLGGLLPFALARTTGRLAFAPFDPLSFPLFLPLPLLGRR